MNTATAAVQLHRMLQVKHLVVNEVLDSVSRHIRPIEYTANDDGVVCGIVMSEALARGVATPRHQRTREQPVEKAPVQIVEDRLQVVKAALRCEQYFPAPRLA